MYILIRNNKLTESTDSCLSLYNLVEQSNSCRGRPRATETLPISSQATAYFSPVIHGGLVVG